MIGKIDLDDPRLTQREELALRRMLEKMDSYFYQGRDFEGRGVGVAMWIFWQTLIGESTSKMGDL